MSDTLAAAPLAPGAVIGVIGGGQLGRMLALAAARLGFDVHVYAEDADDPAARVAARVVTGPFDAAPRLDAFAANCAVITYEREHLPADALAAMADVAKIRPGLTALRTAQDRLVEKRFARDCGVAVADFLPAESVEDVAAALRELGGPAILKTRREGYDGKGQARLSTPADAPAAWAAIGAQPAIVERQVAFTQEFSVIAARAATGAIQAYALTRNSHEDGILRESAAPHASPHGAGALAATRAMATALDYVGVLAVEFFETPDGLLVNEIAPRVHNSGHWTLEGACCDQFEQHIRAIAGWPLGDAGLRGAGAIMRNLLGAEIDTVVNLAGEPCVHVHHYGKRQARPQRKMGHVTRIR